MPESKPPFPPFTLDSARQKVRKAENAWNTRDPASVALGYTEDSIWRNRTEFLKGREQIVRFLSHKWARELDYRLVKELWTYSDDKIAVRFAYEFQDAAEQWFRAYGNENWYFDPSGLMRARHASINDLAITESQRLFRWPQGPRPQNHPGLSQLEL